MADTKSLLDWNSLLQRLKSAMAGGDRFAEAFLGGGIARWEAEKRLGASQATELRAYLSLVEVRDALHHLGVHLVLSVPIPVPGLRNLSRFIWTVACWVIAQCRLLRHKATTSTGTLPNIHGPLVMVVSLLPVLGPFAYLISRPLRNRLLLRLILDQVAWKLPFRLYARLRLDRLLAPAPTA